MKPPNNDRDVLTKQKDSHGGLSWVIDYYYPDSSLCDRGCWYEASMWNCEVLYWEELKPLTEPGKPEGGS